MPRLESKPKPVAAWVWHIKTELICASARPAECISFFKILPEISVPGCAKLLYVSEESRRRGWGTKLIRAPEAEAVSQGCHGAWVDSYSFQARGFYERQGYAIFGSLDNYPTGQKRFFLQKTLSATCTEHPGPPCAGTRE